MKWLPFLAFISSYSFAQTSVSTLIVEGVSSTKSSVSSTLVQLESAMNSAIAEQAEIQKLSSVVLDPCSKEELEIRQKNVDFLNKNSGQIQEICSKIKRGLNVQLGLLRDYENGIVVDDSNLKEYINFEGKPDRSAMIKIRNKSFADDESDVDSAFEEIPVKELILFIKKFESAAALVSDHPYAIEKFKNEWNDPKNKKDPRYFNMTLNQAIKAYERLGTFFAKTNREEQGRSFYVGGGKDIFRVVTTTTIGHDEKFDTVVGSNLQPNSTTNPTVSVTQSFTQAFQTAQESNYWDVIRSQQLSIDGVPIDGYLRRNFYDQLRTQGCFVNDGLEFDSASASGPNLEYSNQVPCTKKWIQIYSASMKIDWYQQSDGQLNEKTGSVYSVTDQLKALTQGKEEVSFFSVSSLFPELNLSQNFGASINIEYRCGCQKGIKATKKINQHYKSYSSFKLSCK